MIFGFIVVFMGIGVLALGSALWVTWMGSLGSLGLVDFYRVPVEILTLLISTGRLKMYQTRVCSQRQPQVCSKRKGADISVMPIAEGASCVLGSTTVR